MAICEDCRQEMLTATSCTLHALAVGGEIHPRVRWGSERHWRRTNQRCYDCGIALGGLHHLGCDIEECPSCGNQLLSCGCQTHDDDDDWDDWRPEFDDLA